MAALIGACGASAEDEGASAGAISQSPTENAEGALAQRAAKARALRAKLAGHVLALADSALKPVSCDDGEFSRYTNIIPVIQFLRNNPASMPATMACATFDYEDKLHILVSVSPKESPDTFDMYVIDYQGIQLTGLRTRGQVAPAVRWDEDLWIRDSSGERSVRPAWHWFFSP